MEEKNIIKPQTQTELVFDEDILSKLTFFIEFGIIEDKEIESNFNMKSNLIEDGLNWKDIDLETRKLYVEEANKILIEKQHVPKDILEDFWYKWSDKDTKNEAYEILINAFLSKYPTKVIRDESKVEMWTYNKGIYVPNGYCHLNRFIWRVFDSSFVESLTKKFQEKIIPRCYVDEEEFFRTTYDNLIPMNNGILDISKKEVIPFDPKYIFFQKVPHNFNPKMGIDKIETFFRDIMDEKQYLTIQEFFGFCLHKRYFLEIAIMLLGSGSNAKSKVLNLLEKMLGNMNVSTLDLEDLEGKNNNFKKKELFGKLANISGELSAKTLEDTKLFKLMTGGDKINADRKFKNALNFFNEAKLICSANQLPKTKDYSDGFFRRWIIIEFNNKFVKKMEYDKLTPEYIKMNNIKLANENILNEITTKEELEGLINWSLEGLERLNKNKSFTLDEPVNDKRQRWLEMSSSFAKFLSEEVYFSEDGDDKIPCEEFNKEYTKFCVKNNYPVEILKERTSIMANTHGLLPKRRNFEIESKDNDQLKIKGLVPQTEYKHCWVGLTWRKK